MRNNITFKIETFEFETRYASQDYVRCGLFIRFENEGREYKMEFDNKSLREILSEVDAYFNGEFTENTETVYYVPWVVGNHVIYQVTFAINVEKNKWFFRYKNCQNDPDFDFVYEMNEADVRSMYSQIKTQYDDICWETLGKSEIYTFITPDKDFAWCYSATAFEASIREISRDKEIRAIYVSATNYNAPLRVAENFVNYYIGSEVILELDDGLIDLLIHAQGLFQWRFFDKKNIEIVGPQSKFIENGDGEFCKIATVYHSFELEYLNSKIEKIHVDATAYWPWDAHGFDQSRLSDPIELPETIRLDLANGNTLSFLGWDDDFVIKIGMTEKLDP